MQLRGNAKVFSLVLLLVLPELSFSSGSKANFLEVPCSGATSNKQGSLSVINSKLPQCNRILPYIDSLIQASVLTRVEAYYHLCDVPSSATASPTVSTSGTGGKMASPTPAPKSCTELATYYQNICSSSGSIFPGTPCDPFAAQDFQVFGITSGCSAESAVNHLGNSCGSYMTLSAAMKSSPNGMPSPSRACMVSGVVAPGGTQAESSQVLGMMIHSLAFYLNQVLSEISAGAMNLTSPMAIAMALGANNTPSNSFVSVASQMIQLQNQPNLADLLICSSNPAPAGTAQNAGVYISGCQTNSVYQSILTNYSQIAVLETYFRAAQAYQGFIQTGTSYSQMAIEKLQFTRGTCNASEAQTKYEAQFPLVIQERANAIWQ